MSPKLWISICALLFQIFKKRGKSHEFGKHFWVWTIVMRKYVYLGCVRESGESRAPFSRNSWMSLSYNNKHNFPSIPLCVSSSSNFSPFSMAPPALALSLVSGHPSRPTTNRLCALVQCSASSRHISFVLGFGNREEKLQSQISLE